jgi:hypothetical protein
MFAREHAAFFKAFDEFVSNYCQPQATASVSLCRITIHYTCTELNSIVLKYTRKGLPLNAWVCDRLQVLCIYCLSAYISARSDLYH